MTNTESAFDAAIARHHAAIDAFARIAQLTDCDANCSTDPYRPDDAHMLNRYALRNLLIALFDDDFPYHAIDDDSDDAPDFNEIASNLRTIRNSLTLTYIYSDDSSRENLTQLALNHSLCPIHLIDYAICFDDDDADCAQIRCIHPSHDT